MTRDHALNALPPGWQRVALRRLTVIPVTNGVGEAASELDDDAVRYIRTTDIQDVFGLDETKRAGLPPERASAAMLLKGDLLMTAAGATVGKSHLFSSDEPACYAGYLVRVRTRRDKAEPRFLAWWTLSTDYSDQVASGAVKSTIENFSASKYRGLGVPLPPLERQRAITDFLDRETAQIDAMIEAQRGLVASLEERKAAISTEIIWGANSGDGRRQVIDPAPPVPSHWQVLRNKWLYRESEELSETGEEDLLTVSHITGITLRSDKTVTMTEAESTEGYRIVHARDLVINTLWGWMGALGVSALNGIVSPAYGVYRPTRSGMDPAFMHHLYRSAPYVCEIQRRSTGIWSSRLRIYPKVFLDMLTVLPPMDEQREIGARLADAIEQMDRTIEAANSAIALMQERRSALVSAAVTGRIDPHTGEEPMAEKVLESV